MQVYLSNPIVAHPRHTLTRIKPHLLSIPNQQTSGRTSLPRGPLSHVSFARRPNTNLSISSSPKNSKKKLSKIEDVDDLEDIDDDDLEALFNQLEEDLKRDDGDEDLEELTAEDLNKLKQELAEVDQQLAEVFDMTGFEDEDDFDNESSDETDDEEEEEEEVEDDEDENEDEEEQKPLQFKNWQLRRLAVALKAGRRKTNIKSLAAEICIERSIVLELLRNPPPSLLMLSASLPDEEPSSPIIPVAAETEMIVEPIAKTNPNPAAAPKGPVHVMQERYSSQKRIKKAHIQTLEDVYRRSKRPTNAMIKSIVEVTNLPRKKVVKWFEDKREEEGVPEQRAAYQRPNPDEA